MKKQCLGPGCAQHRRNWSDPDTPRGPQFVEVPDDTPEYRPVFCSMTCALLAGYVTLAYSTDYCPKCKALGIEIVHGKDYVCPEPEVKDGK